MGRPMFEAELGYHLDAPLTSHRDIEDRLRGALRAAVAEMRTDERFLQRIVNVVCDELGIDPMVGAYVASRLRESHEDHG